MLKLKRGDVVEVCNAVEMSWNGRIAVVADVLDESHVKLNIIAPLPSDFVVLGSQGWTCPNAVLRKIA